MKIAIVGAGITGLTAAHRLTQAGHEVDVYEASDTPGGLGTYLEIGGNHVERFYHHFFASDRHVIGLINELGIGGKLHFYSSKTSIYYDGQLHPFGGPIDLLRFEPLPLLDRLRCGAALAYLKYAPVSNEALDHVAAAQWLKKYCGGAAYRVIWEPLLSGKFEQWADRIPLAWLKDRIRDRTFKLGYLDGSAKTLFDALSKQIEGGGGHIHLGTSVVAVHENKNLVTVKFKTKNSKPASPTKQASQGGLKTKKYDTCIITTVSPIAQKLITSNITAKNQKVLAAQDQLGAVCVILELDRQLQPHYWINVNDRSEPVLVAIEHTNFIPANRYGGTHIVYLANYIHRDSDRFSLGQKKIIEQYSSFLKRVNPKFKKSWIKRAHLSRVPRTQTLFSIGSLHNRPPKRLSKRIYLGNIDQMYPHDRNLNLGVELGGELAQTIEGS